MLNTSLIVVVAASAMAMRCLGLAAETARADVSPPRDEMSSSKVVVQFDPQTRQPRTIVNRESSDSLTLVRKRVPGPARIP